MKNHVRTSSIKSTTVTTGQQKSEASLTERGKTVAAHVRYRSNAAPLQAIDDSILDVEETGESSIKPFEDIPGPASRSIIRAMIDRLPGGWYNYFNTCMSNGISHSYQLEQLVSVLRNVGDIFHFYSIRTFCIQIVQTVTRHRVLQRLIWVCTVCICHTKRTLVLYG